MRAFAYYQRQALETPEWRHSPRMKRLSPKILDAVEAELWARGPLTPRELTDHGSVEPLNWAGWKSTSKVTTLALEVLWLRCRVVVVERTSNGKRYDVSERAVPAEHRKPPAESFASWALTERVEAAGMLCRNAGPLWSMLREVRTSDLPDRLVLSGALEQVQVEGSRRRYLVPPGFFDGAPPVVDDELQYGPLDPFIGQMSIQHALGFEYVWRCTSRQ